eukprot:scaffold251195_cov27-Prasinocladus_malaysianus.AAC.1
MGGGPIAFLLRLYICVDCASQAMSAMVHLETPHVNVLTKMDLVKDKVEVTTPAGSFCCDCF